MSPMLLQVKELLSRNLDAIEIARRMHVNIDYVKSAIEIINQVT
jgi:DNA-binding CsgD family transcriptional regulator